MPKNKKQYAVIGMGRFGSSVAKSLSQMGFNVLAIDANENRTQEISSLVTQAVAADSTDEEVLRALGISNFDVVVVAIGQNIQASILTTLILKEMNAPAIIAKAQNELHGKVLSKIGADKVIFPERDMGTRVAHNLTSPNILDYIELSGDYSIFEMLVPARMVGRNLIELNLRQKYGCNVIAVRRNSKMNISPDPHGRLWEGDVLVVVGERDDLVQLELAFDKHG